MADVEWLEHGRPQSDVESGKIRDVGKKLVNYQKESNFTPYEALE